MTQPVFEIENSSHTSHMLKRLYHHKIKSFENHNMKNKPARRENSVVRRATNNTNGFNTNVNISTNTTETVSELNILSNPVEAPKKTFCGNEIIDMKLLA